MMVGIKYSILMCNINYNICNAIFVMQYLFAKQLIEICNEIFELFHFSLTVFIYNLICFT